jgi:hypothetical protein
VRRNFADQLNSVYQAKPSRSYSIVSCGGAPLSIARQYLKQQHAPQQGRAIAERSSPAAQRTALGLEHWPQFAVALS